MYVWVWVCLFRGVCVAVCSLPINTFQEEIEEVDLACIEWLLLLALVLVQKVVEVFDGFVHVSLPVHTYMRVRVCVCA